ncbi:MAG: FAD-dependent oxidoreductase [Elusimicrobiota bacterium]
MTEKIGIYVCGCGDNIAGKIDIEELKGRLERNKPGHVVESHKLLCSNEGKEFLEKEIKNKKLTKLVIAACSPRQHEETFRKVLESAGLNPYLFQMTNIREQCAWVTEDGDKAVDKAYSFIKGALSRVSNHEAIKVKEIDASADGLVIGGGVAGIEAALTLAQKGRKVVLVEKNPYIGGNVARCEHAFPSMECASCMLEPKMDEVLHNERIEVLTCSEVEEVLGFVGNFTVKIRKNPRLIDAEKCFGCDACYEPCPVSVKNEYMENLSERKAIYTPFAGAMPNVPLIDRKNCLRFKGQECSACSEACAFDAVDFSQEEEVIERKAGGIVVAAGFEEFDCSEVKNLGYKKLAEVYTGMEFEMLFNTSGPTGGKILTKDGKKPESVAIVHCVGSRTQDYNNYCSEVCCLNSLKFASLLKEKDKDLKVYQFYRDFSLPGKKGESFLRKAENEGVDFIRVEDTNQLKLSKNGEKIEIDMSCFKEKDSIAVDMVVLSSSLQGNSSLVELSKMLEFDMGEGGFVEEIHEKLSPVSTAVEGVYVAGCAQGPKDIAASVVSGSASAGKILSKLVPGSKLRL